MSKQLFLTLFLSIALSFPSFDLFAQSGGGDEVPLKELTPPGGIHRSESDVPIICFLYEYEEHIVLSSATLSTTAEVDIVNVTTGTVSTQDVLISSRSVALPLSGPGDYTIEILLTDGTCYYGEFNL